MRSVYELGTAPRAAQSFRVRLLLHGLARAAVDVDVRDLVAEHADAPGLRRLVQGLRDANIELLTLEEELIQLQIANFFAHRRLRERRDGPFRIFDPVTRLVRVDDASVDGPVQVDVDVVLRDGRLGMNINGRLFERPLVRDLVDDGNGEAEARQRRVTKFTEALDLPLFSLGHHQQDGVPVAAVAADADVASRAAERAVSRGAERALPRGLEHASSGHGGGCALLSRGLEETT